MLHVELYDASFVRVGGFLTGCKELVPDDIA
jgi:hypothetical protein